MTVFNSDPFTNMLVHGAFEVIDAGPTQQSVQDLKLKRDSDHKLLMTTKSEGHAASFKNKYPVGTLRELTESVQLRHINGFEIILNAVNPYSRTSTDRGGKEWLTVKSTVQSVSAILKEDVTGTYTVDWLENVHDNVFMWPDPVEKQTASKHVDAIGDGEKKIEISNQVRSVSGGRSAVFVQLGKIEFYLVWIESEKQKVQPGYILYLSDVTGRERKKIRNCLSFALGRPLLSTGFSIFDSDWQLVSFESISPYTLNDQAFRMTTLPTTFLDETTENVIDRNRLTSLVAALYEHYEKYDFEHLIWQYWHAVCAPAHIAPVHFGGCIEALLTAYAKIPDSMVNHTLLTKESWRPISQRMVNVLDEFEIPADVREILHNKITSGLNQSPTSKVNEKVFTLLGLNMSQAEKKVWKQRNKAAHGTAPDYSDTVKIIRDIKVLKVLFHRIILRLIGVEFYIDYCAIGHPRKNIQEPSGTEIK
ncbi:hypothetical protein KFE96_04945 [Kordiimonas sp. SCSIO 12603]|uniref:hypothetical protein n=1 Tax=Kordiimonas sp. SCSIO 12603 TaxID=2829596 RepID=UPI0021082B46|nr:hypothetical protein [Kordiimonas sp. SCSIO 12603]UTW59653.1 hypothetical protein KFE96_04945 [Kordiimonas sp. SCSIO 12603]